MPKKNDFIMNPSTGRMIKIGGRAWRTAVKDGLLEGTYQNENVVYELKEGDDVDKLKIDFDEKEDKNTQVVKGRGRHKNKLVKRRKPISAEDMSEYTRKTAIQVVKDNKDELEDMDEDELDKYLDELIKAEMLSGNSLKNNNKKKEKKEKQQKHYVEESDGDDYVFDEDDFEEDECDEN